MLSLALGLVLLAVLVLIPSLGLSAISWRGDFETGDLSQWTYGVQAAASDRVRVVTSPKRQGNYAARFEVRPGDRAWSDDPGERAEVLIPQWDTDGYEGREQFWAWSTYFDPTFQSDESTAWNYFVQFHNTSATGQANVGFISNGRYLQFRVCNGDPNNVTCRYWVLDSNRQNGRWYDFVFHVKWSSDPGVGFVEIWKDGSVVVSKTAIATLYSGQGVYLKQGYYRAPNYPSTAILYQDGMRRGSSYNEVAGEFPSASTPSSFTVTSNIQNGSTLSGTIPWNATPSGKTVSVVTFSTGDYSFYDQDATSPYGVSLDTTTIPNGTYTFRVDATATDGSHATATATATIDNPIVAPLSVEQNLSEGQTLSGSVSWTATTSGKTVSRVEYWVNGQLVASDDTAPYNVVFDTTRLANGTYPFAVKAVAIDGTNAASTATVNVSNAATSQLSVTDNVWDGLTVAGTYDWSATVAGPKIAKVSFYVDGKKVATKPHAPYETSVDTTKQPDGPHTFAVTAQGPDGASASASAKVVIANQSGSSTTTAASPPSTTGDQLGTASAGTDSSGAQTNGSDTSSTSNSGSGGKSNGETGSGEASGGTGGGAGTSEKSSSATSSDRVITSSIGDGETISGRVTWSVNLRGFDVARVEFLIDSTLMWSEQRAPYTYGGDQRQLDAGSLARGMHLFEIRAIGTDGTVRTLELHVTVA
jgi:Polysaccharide lyase/Bacterial Ig domain